VTLSLGHYTYNAEFAGSTTQHMLSGDDSGLVVYTYVPISPSITGQRVELLTSGLEGSNCSLPLVYVRLSGLLRVLESP